MIIRGLAFAFCLVSTGALAQQASVVERFPPLSTVMPPADAPEMVELGKLLFFDTRLSGDGSTACSECHDPTYGWTDASDLSRGYPGTKHWRNSQTIVNSALVRSGLHWDGGLASLNDQVHAAMGASVNLNIDETLLEERMRQIPQYRESFRTIWNEEPSTRRLAEAIAAYERTLISADSPFDQYLGGNTAAMSSAAMRGLDLFMGKANCVQCHNGALLSDDAFHNTSVPPNPEASEDPLRQVTFRLIMRQSGVDRRVYENLDRDPGRYVASKQPQDLGRFRTAPLRYLKYSAPYMHNGVFFTLEEVVEFYNFGGTQDVFGTKSNRIKPLGLSADERTDLVAFLESLSGTEIVTETPDLPGYEALPGPSQGDMITAAALADMKLDTVPPTPAQKKAPDDKPEGLQIVPRQQQENNGLTIVPRSSTPRTNDPVPEKQSNALPNKNTAQKTSSRIEIIEDERYVTVGAEDTLGSLAMLAYGDSKQGNRIFQANRNIMSHPQVMILGSRLKIPE